MKSQSTLTMLDHIGMAFPRRCEMASDLMLLGVSRGVPAVGGTNFLVQESDGTSKFTLEDGTGSILLEA